nr:S26 family signal peptidase [Caulobacter hibisci]
MSVGAGLALSWRPSPPRLMWNTTASVPVGLYRLDRANAPQPGDLVAVRPAPAIADLLAARGWLPAGVPLLKPIAAGPGQNVCRQGPVVMIDGLEVARAAIVDRVNRPLPVWRGCLRLRPNEVFLLSAEAGSFDGRYMGATPASQILAVARPVLTSSPVRPQLARDEEPGR